nr:CAP domain-containing protein [Spirochaetota bacterium]
MKILYIFFSFFVLLSAGCGFIIPYDSTTTSTSVATTTTANDGTTTTILYNSSSSTSILVVSTTINKSSSTTTSTSTTIVGVSSRKESIVNKWNSLKPKFIDTSCYEISPGTYLDGKLIAPYSIGKLKSDFIKDALNTVNFVRFLAYLPDDVILDDDLITKAQHGSVLLCASSFSHTPAKPADMNEDFYKICYSSTSSSNIAYGYSTLEKSVKDGYMSDADVSNIDRVGHRRWILNPKLLKTGFGFSYKYMTM